MIEASNLRLVANLLGRRPRPASETVLAHQRRPPPTPAQQINTESSVTGRVDTRSDVVVHLSPQGIRASRGVVSADGRVQTARGKQRSAQTQAGEPADRGGVSGRNATAEDHQAQPTHQTIDDLERRDREVRRHEATHKAALGRFAKGGPQFGFITGPDGRRYAVDGEVSVDVSPVPGDPEATLQKMATIRRAALAPGDPSAADRALAADATRKMAAARRELLEGRLTEEEDVQSASAAVEATDATSATPHGTQPTESNLFQVSQPSFGAPVDRRGRLVDIRA